MLSETIALKFIGAFVCDFGREASVPASLCNADIGGGRWSALSVTRSGCSLVGASFVELIVARLSRVVDRMMGRFRQELW